MSTYELVITGGQVLLPGTGVTRCDIGVRDGRVVAITDDLSDAASEERIRAGRKLVAPGAIDAHVHLGVFRDLSEDAWSETISAASEGVTSVLSYSRTGGHYLRRSGPYRELLLEVLKAVDGRSRVDFEFHLAPMTREQLEEVPWLASEAGIASSKYYLYMKGLDLTGSSTDAAAYSMADGYDLGHLYSLIERIARVSDERAPEQRISLSLHCESSELIKLFMTCNRSPSRPEERRSTVSRPFLHQGVGVSGRTCREATRSRRGQTLALIGSIVAILAGACGGVSTPPQSASGHTISSIAILLPGRKTDPGYTGVGYQALEATAKMLEIKTVKVAESVEVSQQDEVYRTFGEAGVNLVIGWGATYDTGAKKAAQQFPNTIFLVAQGASSNGKNYASMGFYDPDYTYLMGYVMGRASKTHKIAYISFTCFPDLAASARAMTLGAQRAEPSTTARYVGLTSFDDPVSAKEAALALIAGGVDVIASNLNTGNQGVYSAAQAHPGTLVTTEFSDQTEQAPSVILTGTLQPQQDLIADSIKLIESGKFHGQRIQVPLTANEEALAPVRSLAPESIYNDAKALQVKIAQGEVKVPYLGQCPYSG